MRLTFRFLTAVFIILLISCKQDEPEIDQAPAIVSFAPTSGLPGTEVTISGRNFSTTVAKNIVKVGTVDATVRSAAATSLTFVVPQDAITARIEVTVNGVKVISETEFTVTAPPATPAIISFTPASGTAGTSVTITGKNFSAVSGNNVVKFGDVAAVVEQASETSLTVKAPQTGISGKLSVTIAGATTTSTTDYTYVPKIDAVSRPGGPIGTQIIITGSGFNPTPALNTVKVGDGSACTISGATANSITAAVTQGSVSGTVTVTSQGKTGTGPVFIVAMEAIPDQGNQGSSGYAIAVDGTGNTFVGGSFSLSMKLEDKTLSGTGLFVAKYDPYGKLIWARNVPGGQLKGIVVDDGGNAYIAGHTTSTTFGSTTITANGTDLFVAKMTGDGNFSWAKNFGGASSDDAFGIDIDNAGSLVVAGSFSGDVTVGSTNLSSTASASKLDIIVIKLNKDNGAPTWARNFGGADDDYATSVSCAPSGDIYVGASTTSPTLTIGPSALTNAGYLDGIFFKVNADGDALWGKMLGGAAGYDEVLDLEANGSNGAIVTGYYTQNATIGGTPITSTGGADFFVAKFNDDGSAAWVKSGGNSFGTDFGYSLAIKPDGNILLLARASANVIIDDFTLPLNGINYGATSVITFNQSGKATAGVVGGGLPANASATTFPAAIAIGPDNVIHVTGSFRYGDSVFELTVLHPSNATQNMFFMWNIWP